MQSLSAGPQTAPDEIGDGSSAPNQVTSRIPTYEFRLLLNTRRRQVLEGSLGTLLAIDVALARIGEGVFGICIGCGSEIDRGRLKSDPTSARCMPCDARAADGQN
jgi:RNA polymerase-binding transcription factor DksA